MTPAEDPANALPTHLVEASVQSALAEDLGLAGDVTIRSTLPATTSASAALTSRQRGVIAGLDLSAAAFRLIGPGVEFVPLVADGEEVEPGTAIARVAGPARLVLAAERVALNFLCHLSGVATL